MKFKSHPTVFKTQGVAQGSGTNDYCCREPGSATPVPEDTSFYLQTSTGTTHSVATLKHTNQLKTVDLFENLSMCVVVGKNNLKCTLEDEAGGPLEPDSLFHRAYTKISSQDKTNNFTGDQA